MVDEYFAETMELSEIVRHVQLNQNPSTHVPDRLGLPRIQPKRESYCHAVTELDGCLSNWEQMKRSSITSNAGDDQLGERLALHLRYVLSPPYFPLTPSWI